LDKRVGIIIVLSITSMSIYFLLNNVSSSLRSITTKQIVFDDKDFSITSNISNETTTTTNVIIVKKQVKSSNSEILTAQQIERFLSYNKKNQVILTNIYDNLQYHKNPVAVLFYLSYAHEKLLNYDEALSFLNKIKKEYISKKSYLYIFNGQHLQSKIYSIQTSYEILMKKAEISYLNGNGSDAVNYLHRVINLPESYFGYGDITFSYSAQAKRNLEIISEDGLFVSTMQKFYSAEHSKAIVKSILVSADKAIIKSYISDKYGCKIFGTTFTTKSVFDDNFQFLIPRLEAMPTTDFKTIFVGDAQLGDANLYRYKVDSYFFEIISDKNTQYLSKLEAL